MPQQNNPRIHILRFGLRGWAAVGVGILALIAGAILVLGLFVLFLPILLLAPVLVYFLPRLKTYSMRKQTRKDSTIIDGEFRVVGTGEHEEDAKAIRDEHDSHSG
jgi:uncharacterized membrane protein YphA (DoxX/SURF4 family)